MFSEPVIGEKFFGRDEVLDLLSKRVCALKDGYRQNIALTGQSLAGKTSILHHFLYSIKDEDFITVYMEVVKESFKSFSKRFLATLLYNAFAKSGEKASFKLDDLLERARESLPGTYGAIKQINSHIDSGNTEEAYYNLLNLTSVLKEEIKRSCVVILDEFDNLEYIGVKNPFLNFGKIIMVQKDTMYVVSSSRNQVIKRILSEKLSLLFGNFEIVRIAGFDIETARLFVETRLGGFEIDDGLKNFIISLTDGNPFYLNNIVRRVKELSYERMSNHINGEVVCQAIMDLVYSANGVIHQYLLNFILSLIDSRNKDRCISILCAIANGHNRLGAIAKTMKAKQSDISKELCALADLGLVSKSGVFYSVDDAMLAFWLKYVYDKRRSLLVDGLLNRAELYSEDLRSYLAEFMSQASKGIIAKVGELFNSFSNDLVEIDSRRLRMPHFTKVEVVESKEARHFAVATFRGSSWIVQPYEKRVVESDIIDYIRNIKSKNYKAANKIIIALRGIDDNARLLAKELKISLWNIETFNNLLTFYGLKKTVI